MTAKRSPFPSAGPPMAAWPQIKRIGPLSAIVLLHIAFFYALQSGLMRQVSQILPREVIATFITREPVPAPPKSQPSVPKTVPVVKKRISPPRPTAPVVNPEPSPQAITTPPAVPVPAEPAAPVVSAPPAVAAPAAPPTSSVQPKTVTSGIEYMQAPQPVYPPVSKRMAEEGQVVLRVLVNEKGRPERVEVQKPSGHARLDEAARQAVLRALFKPFVEDGKAVAAYAIVPIRFQLND